MVFEKKIKNICLIIISRDLLYAYIIALCISMCEEPAITYLQD